jgi:uncharacterized membrane protein YebE (DUF533 family)
MLNVDKTLHLDYLTLRDDLRDMIDAKALLDRFLGSDSGGRPRTASSSDGLLGQVLGQVQKHVGQPPLAPSGRSGPQSQPVMGGAGGFLGGAAAGGLLGTLLGGGKKKKGIGGLLSHGGAAALGALAYRAWQNYQQGKPPGEASLATLQDAGAAGPAYLPSAVPASDGQPFELALIRAMIGAAKADGHIDAEEQKAIFTQVERAGLDAEAKGFVFDALAAPADLNAIAASARTQEQKSEIWLATRLAINPDHPAERAYLDALAHRLGLPPELLAHLSAQASGVEQG